MIRIYTDGSCLKNPGGPGGYAAVIVEGSSKRHVVGRDPTTTNNRMELMAAICGLESLPQPAEVWLYSDSQYLIRTMSGWYKRNRNHDLWDRLDIQAKRHSIWWHWVRGHSGHPENEEADRLAGVEARKNGNEGSGTEDRFGAAEAAAEES